jgi:PAS domain S-box-containing protein
LRHNCIRQRPRGWTRAALWSLIALAVSLPALAEPPTISVTDALQLRQTNQSQGEPEPEATLVGTLISDPLILGNEASIAHLQDETGAIQLFTSNIDSLVGRFHRGDTVEVRGKIKNYRGTDELIVEEIRRLGKRALPPARDVLVSELKTGLYSSQLVRIRGELTVPDDLQQNRGCLLRDHSGEIFASVPTRFFQNPRFSARLFEGGTVTVVGIATQFRDEGGTVTHRIVPRDAADFTFGFHPPYRPIAILLGLLLLLGVLVHLWIQRRSAERRAREIAILSDNLKKSESTLRERENRLRAIIEAEPECVEVISEDGVLLEMNSTGLAVIEADTAAMVIGRPISPLIASEYRTEFSKLLHDVCQGQKANLEFQIIGLKGALRWVEMHAVPLRVDQGRHSVLGLMRDVTERKRGEEEIDLLHHITAAVQETENLLSALQVVLCKVCQATEWFFGQAWTPRADNSCLDLSPAFYQTAPGLKAFHEASERAVIPRGGPLLGQIWESKQPLWVHDLSEISNFARAEMVHELGLRAWLGVPVLAGDQVVAILEFFMLEPRHQEERLVQLVSTIAAQLGSAIQRKQAEEALREAEKKYRSIVENAAEGIFQTRPDGSYLSVNPALARMYGYDSPEQLMASVTDIGRQVYVDPNRRTEFKRLMEEDGLVERFEYQVVRKDDTRIWLSENARTVRDETGQVLFYEGAVEDVTERKRAEEALRESEARYRELFEDAPIAYHEVDTEGIVRRVNQAECNLLGYPASEILGKHIWEFLAPEERELNTEAIRAKIRGEQPASSLQRLYVRRNGERVPVEIHENLIRNQNGNVIGVRSAMLDITGRRTLEDQLRQSQKMEAVGRLAGGVAHDFNNLLGVIIGYSELLLDRYPPSDSKLKHIQEIKKAADRAAGLTRQLLAFSRKQVLAPRRLDVNAVVANISGMLRRVIGEDVELITVPAPSLGNVKADQGQLEQVILNLALNARDAMPRGGKLTIETTNFDLDDAYARRHPSVKPGPYVMLAVSDTGHGMDAETQSHIFEPFFTTKESGKGTGLGLATIYGIIRQSEGHIWVYSEPGKGTTFKIYFPRVQEAAEPLRPGAFPIEIRRGTETVLMVEDEESLRHVTREFLQASGYQVLEARHAAEAIAIVEQHAQPIHLLVTDVVMPKMSGRDLAQRLLLLRPNLKVLYMSGYTDDAILHHGVLDQGVAFLAKPFTRASLARKIREVLEARS